jgi:hypothetical protein
MRVIRRICGVSLQTGFPVKNVGAWVVMETVSDVCRRNRLRWFVHVERTRDDDWVKRCTKLEVVDKRPRGRPRKTWMTTLKDDMGKKRCCVPGGWDGQRFV